jgi:hypothetical protein
MKVTAIILTYNEENRIRHALTHALKWAEEVIVADKCSHDRTCQIAAEMGARVESIPHTAQGEENVGEIHALAKTEWSWGWTPGEVPTRKLIETGLAMTESDVDLIMVPMKYYSFGVHDPVSPWGISYQPRLMRRDRVEFTGIAHDPIHAERVLPIPYFEDCHCLHQTHADARSFVRAHADYMAGEAMNGTPEEVLIRAMTQLSAFDRNFQSNPELTDQMLGWKLYWLGVALHARDRMTGGHRADYAKRAEAMLADQWL